MGAFQTRREIGLGRLTLWVVKSEVAGAPLRKGPAWRSTRSDRGFVNFGGLWMMVVVGLSCFGFFS